MNSLARVSRRMLGPSLLNPVFHMKDRCLRSFQALTLPSPRSFRLFSPPFRGTFQLSLAVLVCYRSRNVFSLGGRCPPSSLTTQGKVLRNIITSYHIFAYGAITLYGLPFQVSSACYDRRYVIMSKTPHLSLVTQRDSV